MLLEKQNSKLLILHYNPFFLHILCRELPKAETTCFSLMESSPTMLCFRLFFLNQQVCTHQSKMLSTRITRLNLYRKREHEEPLLILCGSTRNRFTWHPVCRENPSSLTTHFFPWCTQSNHPYLQHFLRSISAGRTGSWMLPGGQ